MDENGFEGPKESGAEALIREMGQYVEQVNAVYVQFSPRWHEQVSQFTKEDIEKGPGAQMREDLDTLLEHIRQLRSLKDAMGDRGADESRAMFDAARREFERLRNSIDTTLSKLVPRH